VSVDAIDGSAKVTPDYRVEALAKGLRVLSLFSEQRPTMRLTDVVAETGMLMPTVYRIAMTLVSEGYLEQLTDGQYRPGLQVLSLGFSALRGLDLVEIATSRLARLSEITGETVNLGVLTGDKVLYLVRLRNRDLVTANIQVGSTLPAVSTSMGKLLLAYLTEKDLHLRLSAASFTAGAGPRAIREFKDLLPQLEDIRDQGFALQDEEVAFGLRSVAAPVRDAAGLVTAAINVAVNAREWSTKRLLEGLVPQVLGTAAEISALLGHR
jgi:IclR family transcriptional regulator, pca regulon regulatory protein